ncbi:integrase arm-type DNA-binding domain-containing protein [Escherichia coli]|uniref:tyrosine-type recombinase/integrase n=1 Tax=Escherichia coli TaxID=562 RepID=UPI0017F25942|nr:integrase arm-type DNA-binding domain-containing protein [Escherichia coli]EGF8259438.1 integrase arm-type DNA-binding domain-containing protein [Escherichia coli]EGG0910820.1 integrase arm-type DNA-binding domain-containing protein [Escherichia coli]EGK3926899.1 integrase arm-type DNA-binding domain-containing protein [Escherichia coli]EHE2747759.1 integrase arm-type DNA-binding domain-containing protein [Escherichia coli]EHK6183201.1 integrase arm-type DNA-binding domain-containing protei
MSLNDSKIRNLKPSSKPIKLSDSHGLYLLVNPGGSRIWYLKYRFGGKESRVSLGAYPLISLAEARQQRDAIRKLLAQNINPAQQRMDEKAATSPEKCFKAVALAWHKTNKKWSPDYAERILASMNNHIFPGIGHLPVTTLKTQHFTALLRVIEDKGFLEVASRTRQQLCNIMRYAVQQGLTENNPAQHLEGVTAPPVKNHYPALPLERLPELFEHIGDYRQGRQLTRLAVVLTLHLFIRSSELRFARWGEIDFRNKIWTIPATREAIEKVRFSGRGAKMRTPHIVPLSRQAIAILKQIQEISGHLELVFPGDHNPYKPMSENTVNRALRLMGYDTKTDVCGHGFRAMACSALVESELWSRDAVERQMSHQERNSVRAAYIHRAEHLDARTAMMQWWSDYLDVSREGYVAPYIYARRHKAA